MKDKRVFICGITQESNNFNPVLAQRNNFAIRQGEVVCKKGVNWFYVDGVLNVLEEAGIELPNTLEKMRPYQFSLLDNSEIIYRGELKDWCGNEAKKVLMRN